MLQNNAYVKTDTEVNKKMYKDKKDYPVLLEVKHIQEILNIGRKTTYDLLSQVEYRMRNGRKVPFAVKRIGRQIRVPRDQFWEWLESNEVIDLLE